MKRKKARSLSGLFVWLNVSCESVAEVTDTGEDHRNAGFIGRSNHLFITDRTARLNHRVMRGNTPDAANDDLPY